MVSNFGKVTRNIKVHRRFRGARGIRRGDIGSPILALETIRDHSYFERFEREGKTLEFLFVEKNSEFYQSLKRRVEHTYWPSNFKITVEPDEFQVALAHILDNADAGIAALPPTLLFVDPFGPAGFPMQLFRRLASFERIDVLINLNILEFVRWILPDPTKHITADSLYGGPRWRPALQMEQADRDTFLVDEYERTLREIGWRGTSFEMVNRQNQTAYHLVFGTGSPKGLEAIKKAMRDASQTGEFRYTDRIDSAQPVLLGLDMVEQYRIDLGRHLL